MKLDTGQAWTEAKAMLGGQRDILLTVAGAFFLLPALLLATLAPIALAPGASSAEAIAAYQAWTAANWPWILASALAAGVGRLAILILLLAPERPTVGQALAAGAALLIVAFVLNVLIGLIVGVGLLFLIVPGLYLIGRTFLAEAALVGERLRGPIAPLRRGVEISRGNGWRIFFAVAIVFLAVQLLGMVVSWVVAIIAALGGGGAVTTFLAGFISALTGAAASLLLLLMAVAMYRQLTGFRR